MKPTQEQVIAWVREAEWTGIYLQWVSPTEREHLTVPVTMEQIKRAFTLAYEAGRKDEREWQGLMDEEIHASDCITDEPSNAQVFKFARDIEAKLREKNT